MKTTPCPFCGAKLRVPEADPFDGFVFGFERLQAEARARLTRHYESDARRCAQFPGYSSVEMPDGYELPDIPIFEDGERITREVTYEF